MNSIPPEIDLILKHRTIRSFGSEKISESMLLTILESASRASTSGNMQSYSIILSVDRTGIDTLTELHFNQHVVKQAQAVLTFCVDLRRISLWCAQRGESPSFDNLWALFVGMGDAFIAAQNAVLAAESFGLGICYLGSTITNMANIATFLECPSLVIPITSIAMGWPSQDRAQTLRLPLSAVVHREKFRDYTADSIDRLMQEKESRDWRRFCEGTDSEQKLADYSIKNMAGVFTKLRHPRSVVENISEELLSFIRQQGFGI